MSRKRKSSRDGRRRTAKGSEARAVGEAAREVPATAAGAADRISLAGPAIAAACLTGVFLWSYWTSLVELATLWAVQPDYAHGFLVPPLAAWLLWLRRRSFPASGWTPAWGGLTLIAASLLLRVAAAVFYAAPVDGWSIVLWVAGVVWLLGGTRVLRWSSPAILFLLFMVPLPERAERWLNSPLRNLSTQTSCFLLQTLGQPALAEDNTILLGERPLQVEKACSGLRIFVGMTALAYVFAMATRREWWERLLVFGCVVPVALLANSARIVSTALLYRYVSDEVGQRFGHDLSGCLTIPLAAGLFALFLGALGFVLNRSEVVDVGELIMHSRSESGAA